ncbi:MAG: carboxymuconolactone decarboxylase family protein [Candidatus Bathyarchaeota archaeon]
MVAKVYSQIKQDFGRIVEPFTLHSPIPSILAGAWMAARESELVGYAPRSVKEAIAASISKLNHCPYCVDAHTIMIRASGEKRTAKLIAQEKYNEIKPSQTKEIIKWALSTLSPKSELINKPPFTKELAPEIIGTAVFYHYINPLVTIFLGDSPLPFPFFKSQMKPIVSHLFKKSVNNPKLPGDSLDFLPDAKLPQDLSWAEESNNVSGAYARFAKAFSELEETVIPKEIQNIVKQYMDNWTGEIQKSGIDKIEEIISHLRVESKIATKIALLTIFSPYKINQENIKEFRNFFTQQEELLGLTAWASFIRARKIGQNLIS